MRDHHPLESADLDAIKAHPLELRERGFKLYCERNTLPEIGAALAIPAATVAGWSMRGKWKARRALMEAPEPIKEAGTANVLPPSEAAGLSFEEKQTAFRDEAATLALESIREAAQLAPGQRVHNAQKLKQLLEMGQKALDLEKSSPSVIVNVGLLGRGVVRAELMSNTEKPILLAQSDSAVTADPLLTYEGDTGKQPVTLDVESAPSP